MVSPTTDLLKKELHVKGESLVLPAMSVLSMDSVPLATAIWSPLSFFPSCLTFDIYGALTHRNRFRR
ncbi:hypothetical protein Ancab_022011 [Ancistrocladus abbreviatus]